MPTDLLQFMAGMKLVHLLISWTQVQAGVNLVRENLIETSGRLHRYERGTTQV